MNLDQTKLSKSEWNAIEVPVSDREKKVLELIKKGFHNVNLRYNEYLSLFSFLKIEYTPEMEDHLYNLYFSKKVEDLKKKYDCENLTNSVCSAPAIKKADLIRLQKNDPSKMDSENAFEYMLLAEVESILKYKKRGKESKWMLHYFTLFKLIRNSITQINRHIIEFVNNILRIFDTDVDIIKVIENSVDYIERNMTLLKYEDMMLYKHQKDVFTLMKNPGPKLCLYIAPTGTGKTLTPVGLSETFKIIFVCAARHVGLALAKAAISVNKKIAFAFGCASADDIRLHYFAAKDYRINKRTGGIGKVDNSVGDKVEIIICDLKSYLPAMYYMLAFNNRENIIVYWDEPTITLDYESHDLHKVIQKNWSENLIPNMILSSATLPKMHELGDTISDFRDKFAGANIYNIVSNDCKKSIPLINKYGYVVLPHYLSEEYETILEIVKHCEANLTLLRYFDLREVVSLIIFAEKNDYIQSSVKINRHFAGLEDVTMEKIKIHYLKVLQKIIGGTWGAIYITMRTDRLKRIVSNDYVDSSGKLIRKAVSVGPGSVVESNFGGSILRKINSEEVVPTNPSVKDKDNENCAIYVTTKDAYSLTDGPTIFLATNVDKIAKFCIQQANIPALVMDDIMQKIEFNNALNLKIEKLENDLEDIMEKNSKGGNNKEKKTEKTEKGDKKKGANDNSNKDIGVDKLKAEIEALQSMIKNAELNETFIPNKQLHVKKWALNMDSSRSFTSDIDENTVLDIMAIEDVDSSWKILLLMGIGVFSSHTSITYTEIMKKLADQQKLYLILASSDYIYGTNYQFCHGYLSKDLVLTQEKIIQAFGRIGRNNIQQDYSIRLRDDEHIKKLFYPELNKPEVRNMNNLFRTVQLEAEAEAEAEAEPELSAQAHQDEDQDDVEDEDADEDEDEN
jgi:hypothetical protein